MSQLALAPARADPLGLTAAARALLGPGVAVAGGRIADWQEPLHAEEAAAVARAVPARRAEFAAGRAALRAALRLLGHPAVALPRRPDGPPRFPPGLTGTLAHGGGHVVAAVARMGDAAALGLDLEPMPFPPDLAAEVCGEDEDAARAGEAFGAKEAAYKAQFALSGRILGFDALRVALHPGGRFTATFRLAAAPFAPGDRIAGRQALCGPLLLSAARIEAGGWK